MNTKNCCGYVYPFIVNKLKYDKIRMPLVFYYCNFVFVLSVKYDKFIDNLFIFSFFLFYRHNN